MADEQAVPTASFASVARDGGGASASAPAGAGAGAGAIETIVLAAARVAALLLAVGMKRLLLFQDLLGLTRGMQSTKALQDLTLWMTM